MDLFQAAETGNREELLKLLQERCEVNDQNSCHNTSLEMVAPDNQAPDTKDGASLNFQDQGGDTAIHLAAIHGQTGSIEMLVQAGADPNIQNRWGDTPLYIAALNGHLASVEALIHAGADPDMQNRWGNTPLYIAALNKHPESVEALVQAGANTNIQNKDGWTALHCASSKGGNACVKTLLDAGADTALMNHASQTPEDLAGNEAIKNQFRDHHISPENKTLTQSASDGLAKKPIAA